VTDGAEVVVVGGGVIGCATAYELARRGATVTLFERAELAAGASGRNHGLVIAPMDPALIEMARGSIHIYEQIIDEAPVPIRLDRSPIGFLVVAADPSESDAAREEARAAQAAGVAIEHVDGARLHELEPDLANDLADAWLLDDGRRLDPAALTVSLALLAARHGATVRRGLPVRALVREGDGVRGVVTDEGAVHADQVVLAAGPWCGSLLRPIGIDVAVTPGRGWLVHLRPARPLLSRLVNRAGWHLPAGEEALSPPNARAIEAAIPPVDVGSLLHPNVDATFLAGGSRQAVVTHEPEDPDVPRQILRRAFRLLPALADAAVLGAWWGIRPMTPDGRPLVGRLGDGLVVATGHGSQGVILGGATGALAASMALAEEPPFDAQPFDPTRFDGR
jgi:glycine/D-amino acid oxidase-like deaminating enzyme